MGTRIDLPNGQWAELRSVEDVTERQRRPMQRVIRIVRPEIVEQQQELAKFPDEVDGQPNKEKQAASLRLQYAMTNEEADAYNEVTDYATVALVETCSFVRDGEPVPITMDGILDLPGRALDALRRAVSPLVNDLYLDAGPDKAVSSPFGSSNGSATTSEEVPEIVSLASGGPSASSSSGSV